MKQKDILNGLQFNFLVATAWGRKISLGTSQQKFAEKTANVALQYGQTIRNRNGNVLTGRWDIVGPGT
jgi:hypothetical protein